MAAYSRPTRMRTTRPRSLSLPARPHAFAGCVPARLAPVAIHLPPPSLAPVRQRRLEDLPFEFLQSILAFLGPEDIARYRVLAPSFDAAFVSLPTAPPCYWAEAQLRLATWASGDWRARLDPEEVAQIDRLDPARLLALLPRVGCAAVVMLAIALATSYLSGDPEDRLGPLLALAFICIGLPVALAAAGTTEHAEAVARARQAALANDPVVQAHRRNVEQRRLSLNSDGAAATDPQQPGPHEPPPGAPPQ